MGDGFNNNERRKLSHGWKCKDQRGERETGKIQGYTGQYNRESEEARL